MRNRTRLTCSPNVNLSPTNPDALQKGIQSEAFLKSITTPNEIFTSAISQPNESRRLSLITPKPSCTIFENVYWLIKCYEILYEEDKTIHSEDIWKAQSALNKIWTKIKPEPLVSS